MASFSARVTGYDPSKSFSIDWHDPATNAGYPGGQAPGPFWFNSVPAPGKLRAYVWNPTSNNWEIYRESAPVTPEEGATYEWNMGSNSVTKVAGTTTPPANGGNGNGGTSTTPALPNSLQAIVDWVKAYPVVAGVGAVVGYVVLFGRKGLLR